MRIVITGVPQGGKSRLAALLSQLLDAKAISTDLVKDLDWSEASQKVSEWFEEPGPWIIEGVAVPRALRKWQARNPDKPPPFEKIIVITQPRFAYVTVGQEVMGKQVIGLANTQREWIGERWIGI
jgi:adenylate kinase family enzyme